MRADTLSIDAVPVPSFDDIIDNLLKAAREDESDRRREGRQLFFSPATVIVQADNSRLFAYTRDLSIEGIGLLHSLPLEPNTQVTVAIYRLRKGTVHLTACIEWCRPSADAWYLSGGRLLGAAAIV